MKTFGINLIPYLFLNPFRRFIYILFINEWKIEKLQSIILNLFKFFYRTIGIGTIKLFFIRIFKYKPIAKSQGFNIDYCTKPIVIKFITCSLIHCNIVILCSVKFPISVFCFNPAIRVKCHQSYIV